MGSNNTDDRDENNDDDDDISRKRAHTQDRRSRTRSTLISLYVKFSLLILLMLHFLYSYSKHTMFVGTPKDPNAWYPIYNKQSNRVFFAQPSTRKTSWTFPENAKLGIPDPPKDVAIAAEGWTANGKIQHTNQGNVRIIIVYTIELAGGFREYDCTVTYGFDGSHKIENSSFVIRENQIVNIIRIHYILKDRVARKIVTKVFIPRESAFLEMQLSPITISL